jgi:hypothetical protein
MIELLVDNLIDYAGLFPPAQLSLDDTIENYITYTSSRHSHMLAKLILPENLIEEAYLKLKQIKLPNKIPISLLTNNVSKNLNDFHKYSAVFNLENIEEKISDIKDLEKSVSEASSHTNEHNSLRVFFELDGVLLRDTWEKEIIQQLEILNKYNSNQIGLKIRCGGVTPDLTPKTERLAEYLKLSANIEIPIKFTAGLHHPLYSYHQSFSGFMHGFLNVYLATFFAYKCKINTSEIIKILEAKSLNDFKFSDKFIRWQSYEIANTDISILREKRVFSFGSCSFDEPIDDLRSLGLL